jgi:hypothetical protein
MLLSSSWNTVTASTNWIEGAMYWMMPMVVSLSRCTP